MLSRLLEVHETILVDAHDAAAKIAELGDDGSNDLIVSEVIRTGELQAWFLVEHLVDTPLVRVLADARQHNAEPLELGFFCAERLTLPTPRSLYLSGTRQNHVVMPKELCTRSCRKAATDANLPLTKHSQKS